MKRKLVVLLAVPTFVVATAAPALAAPNEQACFGQARSSSVQLLTDQGYVVGRDFFSQRKGDNAQMNADFREACQTA
jgi:hypothetical protein